MAGTQSPGGADRRRLEELLQTRRPGAQDVRERAALHRGALAELARRRRLAPGSLWVREFEQLVRRSHYSVYRRTRPRIEVLAYLRGGYWCSVRALGPSLWLATTAFAVAVAAALIWGVVDEQGARSIVPSSFIDGAAPPDGGGISAAQSAAFSAELFTNNIRVTFLAFAAGLIFGVGSLALLIYNGAILGAVLGIAAANGNLLDVLELVVAHGLIELSCIVVCGAAGTWMGWALVKPGTLSRSGALSIRAGEAVGIVLGTAPWLVLAGVIEAFISPQGMPSAVVLTVGFAAFACYWALVARAGRAPAPAVSRADR